MEIEPIKAVFTYMRDEYIRAMRRHYRTNIHVYRDIGLGIVMAAVGLWGLYAPYGNKLYSLVVLIPGLVLLLLVAYALFVSPILIYRSYPKLRSEYSLTFYDDRIEFKTENVDSNLGWQLYHSWLRDDEFYILYHGKRNLSVIPRRVLTSPGDDERFAEILRQKIGPPLHMELKK